MDLSFLQNLPLEMIKNAGYAIGGSFAGGMAIYNFGWKPIYAKMKEVVEFLKGKWKSLNDAHTELMNSLPIIKQMAEEFKPNGGNSLRDAINRLESGLSEVMQKNRILASEMNLACYETDKQGMCVWVSSKWQELAGLSAEQAKGNGWINAIRPNERDSVFNEWSRCLEQKRDFSLEYSVNPENPIKVRGYSYLIKDRKGVLLGIMGTLSKID